MTKEERRAAYIERRKLRQRIPSAEKALRLSLARDTRAKQHRESKVWHFYQPGVVCFLLGEKKVLVDWQDFRDLVAPYPWCLRQGYVTRWSWDKPRRLISLHREITQCPEGLVPDHINHDPLDNRRSNLRCVTNAENLRNRKPKSSEKLYQSDSTNSNLQAPYSEGNKKDI